LWRNPVLLCRNENEMQRRRRNLFCLTKTKPSGRESGIHRKRISRWPRTNQVSQDSPHTRLDFEALSLIRCQSLGSMEFLPLQSQEFLPGSFFAWSSQTGLGKSGTELVTSPNLSFDFGKTESETRGGRAEANERALKRVPFRRRNSQDGISLPRKASCVTVIGGGN